MGGPYRADVISLAVRKNSQQPLSSLPLTSLLHNQPSPNLTNPPAPSEPCPLVPPIRRPPSTLALTQHVGGKVNSIPLFTTLRMLYHYCAFTAEEGSTSSQQYD